MKNWCRGVAKEVLSPYLINLGGICAQDATTEIQFQSKYVIRGL
jgi:hypothetical protein